MYLFGEDTRGCIFECSVDRSWMSEDVQKEGGSSARGGAREAAGFFGGFWDVFFWPALGKVP